MKIIRCVSILCFAGFLYSGCEKGPFDYRKKYEGDFTITYNTSWSNYTGNSGSSTAVYGGSVGFDKTVKRKIRFNYNNVSQELTINSKGQLFMCEKKIGKFENRNKFTYKFWSGTCGGYAMGGSGTFEVTGVRK